MVSCAFPVGHDMSRSPWPKHVSLPTPRTWLERRSLHFDSSWPWKSSNSVQLGSDWCLYHMGDIWEIGCTGIRSVNIGPCLGCPKLDIYKQASGGRLFTPGSVCYCCFLKMKEAMPPCLFKIRSRNYQQFAIICDYICSPFSGVKHFDFPKSTGRLWCPIIVRSCLGPNLDWQLIWFDDRLRIWMGRIDIGKLGLGPDCAEKSAGAW